MNNEKQDEIKDNEMIKPDKDKFSIDINIRGLAIGLIIIGVSLICYGYFFGNELNTEIKDIIIDSIEFNFEENKLYLYSDNDFYYIKYNMYNTDLSLLYFIDKKVIILYNKNTKEIFNLKYDGD